MAQGRKTEPPESLMCPLCLDTFEDAKLLSCGHTFCLKCLENYDKCHHDLDHMVCPNCRKPTKFSDDRVQGLLSNVTVNGLVEELRQQENKFGNQDLGKEVRNKMKSLVDRSTKKKDYIKRNISTIEDHRRELKSTIEKLKVQIHQARDNKIKRLQQNDKLLLKEVELFENFLERKLNDSKQSQQQMLSCIETSVMLVSSHHLDNLEGDSPEPHNHVCRELEELLKKGVDEELADHVLDAAKKSEFVPAGDGAIDLGKLVTKDGDGNVVMRVKLPSLPRGIVVAQGDAPIVPVLNVVKEVELPGWARGMAAMPHECAVCIVYGPDYQGACVYGMDGRKRQHLQQQAGSMWDIAFLSDGRSVESDGAGRLKMYNADGSPTNHEFVIPLQRSYFVIPLQRSYFAKINTDHNDNIYAVNKKSNIYVFKPTESVPTAIIPTGTTTPLQICTTKSGTIVASTCNTTTPSVVTLYDRDSNVGSTITKPSGYLYAAVDSQDRLYIAWVKKEEGVLSLTRYTLDGIHVRNKTKFQELKLTLWNTWCYMQCLSPDIIAFVCYRKLYFIEVPY